MPSYSLTRSRYDSYLIILTESGSMEILLEDGYQTARKGDVVIIDCYKSHAYKSGSGCKALWMHFDGAMAGSYFEYLLMGRNNDQLEDRILVSDSSSAI
jgi:phage-related protein